MDRWPALPLAEWRDTYDTLHMWTQVVGKLTLSTTALVNHYWNVAFHYTARGLATQPMEVGGGRTLVAFFDFITHELRFVTSDGRMAAVALKPKTVARFYAEVMEALQAVEAGIRIWTMPVECEDPIPFEKDTKHHAYDRRWAEAFWGAMLSMRPVFEDFRCRFVGKCSPLHFFWGSFDLALTRFSGRRASGDPPADRVMAESYSHEVISHGWWPGGGAVQDAAFYAYAAPQPAGFDAVPVRPAAAHYNREFGQFILPYEAVRTAPRPEEALMAFLESTYDGAARLAGWDRAALER